MSQGMVIVVVVVLSCVVFFAICVGVTAKNTDEMWWRWRWSETQKEFCGMCVDQRMNNKSESSLEQFGHSWFATALFERIWSKESAVMSQSAVRLVFFMVRQQRTLAKKRVVKYIVDPIRIGCSDPSCGRWRPPIDTQTNFPVRLSFPLCGFTLTEITFKKLVYCTARVSQLYICLPMNY